MAQGLTTSIKAEANGDVLSIGDVVRLNSDAVRMTVGSIANGRVVCRWHDDERDLLSEDFDPRELTLVPKREAA
jgi:uncharacterized protein YodC (DUF2158 family)